MIKFAREKMTITDAAATPHGWVINANIDEYSFRAPYLLTLTGEQKQLVAAAKMEIIRSLVKGNWLHSIKFSAPTYGGRKDRVQRYEETYLTPEGTTTPDQSKAWTFQALEDMKLGIALRPMPIPPFGQSLTIRNPGEPDVKIDPIPEETLQGAYLSIFDNQTILVITDKTIAIIDNPVVKC